MSHLLDKARRDNLKPRRDTYNGFGILCDGTRTARAGGRVKFDGFWYQHEKLLPFVGCPVLVYTNGGQFSTAILVLTDQRQRICEIDEPDMSMHRGNQDLTP